MPNEPHEAARIIIVDPRRTVTINACEEVAGKDNVLHLAINSGTDLALFNALFTYIADKGWVDREFIDKSTLRQEAWHGRRNIPRAANRTASLTFVQLRGRRRRLSYVHRGCRENNGARASRDRKGSRVDRYAEGRRKAPPRHVRLRKGLIWGNDNYRTNGAVVNIALATGNIGRPGGGVVRLGGHQEGYVRPSDAHVGRPAAYVDQLLIGGQGGVHHIWGCDHYKTTLNAHEFKRVYKKRTDMVKDAMSAAPMATVRRWLTPLWLP